MRNSDDDDNYPLQSTSATPGLSQSNYKGLKSRTSLVHVSNQKCRLPSGQFDLASLPRESASSFSKAEPRFCSRSREDTNAQSKLYKKGHPSLEKVFSRPDFVVSDCWKTTSREIPVKLIQLLESNAEEEDAEIPVKKKRMVPEEENNGLYYTKEFHVLTEVQKAKILTVVEDTIKKLANKDLQDYSEKFEEVSLEKSPFESIPISSDKFCKKIFLPWVIMKVVELVWCHIIQLTFLSEASYFEKKNEFLPIVVTFYITLFIIIISLILHTSCFSYSAIRNPCYIMSVISCSILTLTTTLGMMVMLISMRYYRFFQQILVLIFISCLLSSLFAELCLSYVEVKHIWKRMEQTGQLYLA